MKNYLLLPHAFQGSMLILNNKAHTNSFNIRSWGFWIEIFQSRYAFPHMLQLLGKIVGSNLLLLLYINELVEKSTRPVNLQETRKKNWNSQMHKQLHRNWTGKHAQLEREYLS
jgi:hypothetical protein